MATETITNRAEAARAQRMARQQRAYSGRALNVWPPVIVFVLLIGIWYLIALY
ncbi:MAG: hypothetical protein JWN36_1183 [Microbacteriaceae bacterium]|nr:hypothetical protein [Microbacteriaceae bacterium]